MRRLKTNLVLIIIYCINKLEIESRILDSQVKFIIGLIANKIKISNKSKQEIIEILRKEKLYLIKDEPEYDYLTRMPIYSFSKEKVDDLNKKYTDKFITLVKTVICI